MQWFTTLEYLVPQTIPAFSTSTHSGAASLPFPTTHLFRLPQCTPLSTQTNLLSASFLLFPYFCLHSSTLILIAVLPEDIHLSIPAFENSCSAKFSLGKYVRYGM